MRRLVTSDTFLKAVSLSHMFSALFLQTRQAAPTPNSTSPLPPGEVVDLEEQRLRQKLHELTDNISDHSLTSDEEESSRPEEDARPSRLPTRPASRASVVVSRLEEEKPEQTDAEKV